MAIAERVLHLHRLAEVRPDDALIQAAQEGEREAASALVERYYPRVHSFVSYLTNGRSNAEDLTQEVFARALTALGRFNGNYRFEPWLLRIARNLVIDEARRRVHQPEATDPSELPEIEPIPVSLDHVWDSISQQLSTSTVNAALQRLPLRQRTVLVLREIEEMAYADIAQVVGTNVRGVEATLRRARARFRIEVANLESAEAHAAVCRRTLRLIASDGIQMSGEASEHLSRCPECRGKATTVGKADRLFAAMPPVAFAAPGWHAKGVAGLPERAFRHSAPKGLIELVRSGITHVYALPIGQIVEVAASVAIAAVVTTTPVKASPSAVRVDAAQVQATQVSAGQVSAGQVSAGQVSAGQVSAEQHAGNPETPAGPAGAPVVPAAAPDGNRAGEAADAGQTVTQADLIQGASAQPAATQPPLGLLDGAILPAAGQLLSDPIGTLTGVVDSLPSALTGTLDVVAGTVGSTLQDPLGTVQNTVEGVTGALPDIPVVGDILSQLPLKQVTGTLRPHATR